MITARNYMYSGFCIRLSLDSMFHYLVSSKSTNNYGSNEDESILIKLKHSWNTHQSFNILLNVNLELECLCIYKQFMHDFHPHLTTNVI